MTFQLRILRFRSAHRIAPKGPSFAPFKHPDFPNTRKSRCFLGAIARNFEKPNGPNGGVILGCWSPHISSHRSCLSIRSTSCFPFPKFQQPSPARRFFLLFRGADLWGNEQSHHRHLLHQNNHTKDICKFRGGPLSQLSTNKVSGNFLQQVVRWFDVQLSTRTPEMRQPTNQTEILFHAHENCIKI